MDRIGCSLNRDPYYGQFFAHNHATSWIDCELVAEHIASGRRIPAPFTTDIDQARQRILASTTLRPMTVNILGFLHMWRTATAQQVARALGEPALASGKHRLWFYLLALGVIERGIQRGSVLTHTPALQAEETIFRVGTHQHYRRNLEPHLTIPERVAITGGANFDAKRQYPRHNVLTTEIGLRSLEQSWCALALGEQFAGHDLLTLNPVGGHFLGTGGWAAADAVLIRKDGMRIAIELTTAGSPKFAEKANRWGRLLSLHRLNDCGLAVIFVVAPTEHNQIHVHMRSVRAAVAKAAQQNPGLVKDRTANRMGVVAWGDWWDKAGNGDFGSLSVWTPDGNQWVRKRFADPPKLDNPQLLQVISESRLLAGTLSRKRQPFGNDIAQLSADIYDVQLGDQKLSAALSSPLAIRQSDA